MDAVTDTIIQRTVPPAMLGRVFGNLYGAIGVAAGLSYMLGGLLLDLASPRFTFVVASTGGLLATLATAMALRRATRLRAGRKLRGQGTDWASKVTMGRPRRTTEQS